MRIAWDLETERFFTSGVSQAVLYPENSPGVAWNGLISVTEHGNQDANPVYFDGQRIRNRNLSPAFSGKITAFTYPDEFEPYIGITSAFTAQNRQSFGFSYRTNDAIHLVYNAVTEPSNREYVSVGSEIEPAPFEWNFATVPVEIPGGKPSSHIMIILKDSDPLAITDLEALIYGDVTIDPSLPQVADIIAIFESYTTLRITDNGDGTWTADGPVEAITIIDSDTFEISWPSVIFTDGETYRISSL